MPHIAKVAVDLSLNREFDYLIPEELVACVKPGTPVRVPFGRREVRGWVTALAEGSSRTDLKAVLGLAGREEMISAPVLKLARWVAEYYGAPVETALRTVLPGAVRRVNAKPLERLVVRPGPKAEHAPTLEALGRRAPKQAIALEALRAGGGERTLAGLARDTGLTPATIRAMEKKDLVVIEKEAVARDPLARHAVLPTEPLPLMAEQAEALATIRRSIESHDPSVVLLYGVTGSGKTEVYLQALQFARERGLGGIVLVPEIALTPQTVDRFRARFGEGVAVLHSALSDGERHDEWHRIRDGRAPIVVGARSALFAPVPNLGLIVVDEEHEPTYKQDEAPRYHARDVAVMRGRLEHCAVVLGSATPSLESWCNAQSGKYGLATLPHRVDHRTMPVVRVVDMRVEAEREGKAHLFSRDLVVAMQDRLARAEQTILFLNRRGFSTSLICPACGYVAKCAHCSVSLVFHRRAGRMRCHMCGADTEAPARCPNPACGSPEIRFGGAGTERIEDILRRLFPRARVARMDADTMDTKDAYRRVLGDFRVGEIDILLGTQMIAKGLDFPNVTLVGVIQADVALHRPDFRAGERTFQLLTQVAGRAGRGDVSGEVIVQTYTPFHPAVMAAAALDFDGFAAEELKARRELSYPPYARLALVTVRGADEVRVSEAADGFVRLLAPRLSPKVIVAGPTPAPLARLKGLYRYQVLLRSPTAGALIGPLRETLAQFAWPKDITAILDMDAVSVL